MNIHFKKILGYVHGISHQAALWFKEQKRSTQILVSGIGIVLLIGALSLFSESEVVQEDRLLPRKVEVKSIGELSSLDGNLPLIGTVTSVSEATIRSETSGKLVRVYKKLGDYVGAGAVIAEFENSGERASVLQAEGAYDQAKASRAITSLNSNQAGTSLLDTKTQALNTILATYSTLDDAVRGKTDSAFRDPQFDEATFLLTVPDANLVISIENKRKSIEKILKARELRNRTLTTSSDLIAELTVVSNETQTIKTYLDELFAAYSKALPDSSYSQAMLDAGKASVQAARQSVSGSLAVLLTTKQSLSQSMTASEVATSNSGTLATADAQVKQALGAYNAALSRLEKTIIRSPINGTLNSLSISTGDYIGAFTQVAVVSNNGALEIVSSVTEDDAKRITAGSLVTINEAISGVVTRIASAIDPTTKKIEVRIGIKDAKSPLVNGQTVRVTIAENKKVVKKVNTTIIIPISALKLTPRGAYVFTVSASNTLVSLPVKEGAILGEQIQILSGLQGDEEIVVDARGLKEGTQVEIAQ